MKIHKLYPEIGRISGQNDGAYFGDRIIGITGNTDAILSLAKSWGVYRKKISTSSGYTIDHTATVFMLSDSGKFQGTIAWGENDQIVKQKLERLWYK